MVSDAKLPARLLPTLSDRLKGIQFRLDSGPHMDFFLFSDDASRVIPYMISQML